MSDNITLPDDDEQFTREDVVTLLLEVMDWTYAQAHRNRPMTEAEQKVLDDIRAALAAEQPKPEPGLTELARQMKPLDADMAAILHDNLDSLYIEDEPALAAEQPVPTVKESLTHPGYVIGSHWLETAYSRICAGEAEADVLRDCGWERVDDAEALRAALAAEPTKHDLMKWAKDAGSSPEDLERFATYTIATRDMEIATLREENEAMRRDAERLKDAMRKAMAMLDKHEPEPAGAFAVLLLALNPELQSAKNALRREGKR